MLAAFPRCDPYGASRTSDAKIRQPGGSEGQGGESGPSIKYATIYAAGWVRIYALILDDVVPRTYPENATSARTPLRNSSLNAGYSRWKLYGGVRVCAAGEFLDADLLRCELDFSP